MRYCSRSKASQIIRMVWNWSKCFVCTLEAPVRDYAVDDEGLPEVIVA